MQATHYDVLEVDALCSVDEIRRAYHRAARRFHPDKQGGQATVEDAQFVRVQEAYETLRDPVTRAKYDEQLQRLTLQHKREGADARIADEVTVEDMEKDVVDEDGESWVVYSHACRCGDTYEVTEDELLDGIDIVPCTGCSLNIRVLGKPGSA
ncbi:TPA: hypothetical protein N0F65_011907 [Lagenidium giganteum]|uniref:Diphthamide biosynthesis protein 4 n=1 Tax=Lagenidium giganteum TaxID=4803 RepID=A0AAV2YQQ0_9STRA|nr:TPA: hypothetical protein N0F65_011907 [Lagenidium giganteum]